MEGSIQRPAALPLDGKVIVNFGDSIFGNKRPPNDVSTALAELTGATVHNLGFGGCTMAEHIPDWGAFSMCRLAEAVASGDYSEQNAVTIGAVPGMPAYFEETRALLASLDFARVDIVTIAYGTNDYSQGYALMSEDDPLDCRTYGGALRYSIERLLGAYPHLKLFPCSQTYRYYMDASYNFLEDSDTQVNRAGLKLTDYVETTRAIAAEYKLTFIDNYYELGINKINRLHWFFDRDGTHHNVRGGRLLAEHMAKKLF